MSLSASELAYGQQKNREYIWQQCKREFIEVNGEAPSSWKDEDQMVLDARYVYLCKQANITPW